MKYVLESRSGISDPWAEYADVPHLNPRRIQYGDASFTYLERTYRDGLARLPANLGSAIEFGCGDGRNLMLLLSERRVVSATGLDKSEGALRRADRLAVANGLGPPRLRLVQMPFEAYRDAAAYDLVLALQFLNYLSSPAAFFARVAEIVRPGGYVFVSDVQRQGGLSILDRCRVSSTLRRLFGKRPFTPGFTPHAYATVERAATMHGFTIVWVTFHCHLIARQFVGTLYWLSTREYSSPGWRRIAAAAYSGVRSCLRIEDRWLGASERGGIYAVLFRRGNSATQ